jgi:DNA-binding LacI/PurR family transcriptional regulator
MGYKSAELLIKRIENNDLPEVNEIIPTKLILRDSTRKMKIS